MALDLSTKIAGIPLKNPTVLPAGFLGTSGELLKRVAEAGAGAVTTKSLSLKPREGHKNPTVLELESGFMNAIGLSNPGVDNFLKEIKTAKEGGVPVIVSIVGETVGEFVEAARKIESAKPDFIELNVSCPNVEKGTVFGTDRDLCSEVTEKVKKAVKVPVIVKLTPNVQDIAGIAKAVEEAGADCISAINTVGPGMVIDIETAKPVLGNKSGGISGPLIKPVAVRCVYQVSQAVKIPVIGMGGISNWQDAVEMLIAGASAVGIGTVLKDSELGIFKEICAGMGEFMDRKKYKRVSDLVGLARR